LSSLASITATPSSPAFRRVHWRRCNEYKTLRLDWCLIYLDRRSFSPALQQQAALAVGEVSCHLQDRQLMHQILHNRCSSYLVDFVAYNVTDPQRRQFTSSTTRAAVVRRTRTEFGKRAFSVCGPDVWNSFPVAVRNIDNHPAFRRALKSHLFNCAFSS